MVALLQKQSIAELEGASYERWVRDLVEQSDAGEKLCDYLRAIIFNGDEEREPFVYHLPQNEKSFKCTPSRYIAMGSDKERYLFIATLRKSLKSTK